MNKYKVSKKTCMDRIQRIIQTLDDAQLGLLWLFLLNLKTEK